MIFPVMLLRKLANRLIRLSGYPQEYLCLESAALNGRFEWRVRGRTIDPREVRFLGYRPLVLGLTAEHVPDHLNLELHAGGLPVAGMRLTPLAPERRDLVLFSGSDPWQRFLPFINDRLDRLRQRLNMQDAANVTQAMTEYDLLRIAYAQPREIHLAVVGPQDRCNMFPTDLHGSSGKGEYIISLRHTGRACGQVMEEGRLLLCRMALDQHRVVYALGSRHMAAPTKASDIAETGGVVHDHALPSGTRSTLLLELIDHHDIGIHRLLRFAVKDELAITDGPILAHMHAGPLGWLKRQGLAPTVFLR